MKETKIRENRLQGQADGALPGCLRALRNPTLRAPEPRLLGGMYFLPVLVSGLLLYYQEAQKVNTLFSGVAQQSNIIIQDDISIITIT